MKKFIVFIIAVSITLTSYAQVNFEGTIKWSISLKSSNDTASTQNELTPAQKEDLKKGIAELEKNLNDPNMQAMFESNPSMKAMLEQQLATMKAVKGENLISDLLPKSFTIKMKDGNSYTQLEGGVTALATGDILYLKGTDKKYYIKKAAKTYSVAPKSKAPSSEEAIVSVVATTETAKILTYTCTKYIVTFTEAGKIKTMFVWATKDLKQYTASSFHTSGVGNQSNMAAFKKIEGVPLKIEMSEQGQTVVMEVVELKNAILPASDFILPLDYKEVPFGQ